MVAPNILLLGDGSHLFRTLGWVLEYKGFRVRATDTPEAAIEELVRNNFELVMAKVGLNDLDGLAVLKRAQKLNPETKVMVISGNGETKLPLEAYQADVDDYILMPVSPGELWRRVSRCLESGAPEAAAASRRTEPNLQAMQGLLMMFHDIRSSVVSSAATLKLLRRGVYGSLGQEANGRLDEVYRRLTKLTEFTEEFVSRAYGDGDVVDIERQSLDLMDDIVEPALQEFSAEIRDRGINVDNRLHHQSTEDLLVKGSKFWLQSAFRNLLSNAIKHGGDGCDIVIDAEDHGSDYRLHVYNTGSGVPQESCPLLFSKLSRKRAGRAGAEGLGLGLALSRDIVMKHGGDIWYEPKQGGADFVMALPRS
jgi:two-component system, sensor histidine kinase and response regulator